jgi:hypothetical protein
VLRARLFPSCIQVPARWVDYYRRSLPTRRTPNAAVHTLKYAA